MKKNNGNSIKQQVETLLQNLQELLTPPTKPQLVPIPVRK